MKTLPARLCGAFCLLVLLCLAPWGHAADPKPSKILYHLNEEGPAQAKRALRFIQNQMSVDPTAKIVVVAHAAGIDFLLKGAVDQNDVDFKPAIADLVRRGVEFKACNLTLLSRRIDRTALVSEAEIVPSGVNEIARLQIQEGFAYIRP